MTPSPVSPAPVVPTVPEAIVTFAPTPAPTRGRPRSVVVCTNDCGYGKASSNRGCVCVCEEGAELVNNQICLFRRPGSAFALPALELLPVYAILWNVMAWTASFV